MWETCLDELNSRRIISVKFYNPILKLHEKKSPKQIPPKNGVVLFWGMNLLTFVYTSLINFFTPSPPLKSFLVFRKIFLGGIVFVFCPKLKKST